MATDLWSGPGPDDPDPVSGAGCAFVLDAADGATTGTVFCDAPTQPGSAYCPTHHARCHLPSDSAAERRHLREIEALAEAVGGRSSGAARRPPPGLLRRLDRIARTFSSARRSRIVRNEAGDDAAHG